MENLSKFEIAKVLGIADGTIIYGTQDSRADTHDHLIVSQLVYDQGNPDQRGIVPFRVRNLDTGEAWTKLPDENIPLDVAAVDKVHSDIMLIQVLKNGKIIPALMAAIPELDPECLEIIQLTMVGGKQKIADLVGGAIKNIRDPVSLPVFSVAKDGTLSCDLSLLPAEKQSLAQDAIEAVIADSGSGLIVKP